MSSSKNRSLSSNEHPATKERTPLEVLHREAMAMPVSFFDKKAKEVHSAMRDVVDHNMDFNEVAKKYIYKPGALAVAFAVFGTQAMNIINAEGVVSVALRSLVTC